MVSRFFPSILLLLCSLSLGLGAFDFSGEWMGGLMLYILHELTLLGGFLIVFECQLQLRIYVYLRLWFLSLLGSERVCTASAVTDS